MGVFSVAVTETAAPEEDKELLRYRRIVYPRVPWLSPGHVRTMKLAEKKPNINGLKFGGYLFCDLRRHGELVELEPTSLGRDLLCTQARGKSRRQEAGCPLSLDGVENVRTDALFGGYSKRSTRLWGEGHSA